MRERFPTLTARDVARCMVVGADALGGTRILQLDVGRSMALLASDPKKCR
jgi:hypothetical protein